MEHSVGASKVDYDLTDPLREPYGITPRSRRRTMKTPLAITSLAVDRSLRLFAPSHTDVYSQVSAVFKASAMRADAAAKTPNSNMNLIPHLVVALALTPLVVGSASADFTTRHEDFNTQTQYNYSTWLVGCFGGAADIRTMDAYESLVVYSGFLDHNANGMIAVSGALTNNFFNEQTFIVFNEGYEWDYFAGDFSCVWNATTPGLVSFTFIDTTTSVSQTIYQSLEGLNGSLRSLQFSVAGGFNQIIIHGNGVIMDNLVVSIPTPAAAPLFALAGLTAHNRGRK